MRTLPGQATRVRGKLPPTRDEIAADQRRRILDATVELVAKRGYRDVSVEALTRRARVSHPTFRKHFSGLEECLLAAFDRAVERATVRIRAALDADAGRPWAETVVAAIAGLFGLIAAHPAEARLCLVETLGAGPTVMEHYEAGLSSLEPLLLRGRDLNPRGVELPDTLENTLVGGVLWIAYRRLVVGAAAELPALVPEAAELVLTPYVGEAEAVRVATDAGARGVDDARS